MAKAKSSPKKQIGSVFDLPGKSLKLVRENWQMFALVNIFSILSAVFALGGSDKDDKDMYGKAGNFDFSGLSSGQEVATVLGLSLIFGILFLAVAVFLYAMKVDLELRVAKGEKPVLKTLFEAGKKYSFRLFGLAIVNSVIVVIGLILFIVPGVIAFGRLVLSPYHLIDKDLGVFDSIKASNEMAKKHTGPVWHVILLYLAIALLGSIISGIPYVGPLIGTVIIIAYSLLLALRYFEVKAVGSGK